MKASCAEPEPWRLLPVGSRKASEYMSLARATSHIEKGVALPFPHYVNISKKRAIQIVASLPRGTNRFATSWSASMLMRIDNCRSGSAVAVALSNSGERRSCCRGCRT